MRTKILLIIFIAAIISACSGSRKLTENNQNKISEKTEQNFQNQTTSDSKVEVKEESSSEQKGQAESNETQQDDVVIITITYDTDKPVLPDTGKPPVASESIVRKVSSKSKQEKNQTSTTGRVSTDYKSDQAEIIKANEHSEKNKTSSESSEITTNTKENKGWMVPTILIVIAAGAGVYVSKKGCWRSK